MLRGITVLLACQCAGEVLSRLTQAPLPGPVIGLLLLLGLLVLRGGVSDDLRRTAGGLLGSLGLLFVPAGVGIVTELGVLGRNWVAISVALLVSVPLGMAVTAWLMHRLSPDPPAG